MTKSSKPQIQRITPDQQLKAKRDSEQGGSLVELALVIPFLTAILFGIVEIGQILSEMSWATHTACQTANFGSTANKTYGEGSMSALWDQLYQIQDDRLKADVASGFTADYTGANDEVAVSANPEVKGVFGKLQTKLGVNCTGSYLIKTVDSLENFDGFANKDTGEYYNCSGTVGSANATACNWSPPPPPASNGGDGGCNCFAGDTLITLADGSKKPISEMAIGDLVLAWDESALKQTSGKVTKNFVRDAHGFYILNGSIRVTEEHPFYVAGKWVNTKDLKIGDKLTSSSGTEVEIKSIETSKESLKIFNMTVDSAHTYYAGGVLVHNKNCGGNNENNPNYGHSNG